MDRILTQPDNSNLQKSTISKKKNVVLMKIFRKSSHTQQSTLAPNILQNISTNNEVVKMKTQRKLSNQQNQQQNNKLQNIKIKTQITDRKSKKHNIFDNDYVNCLKNGFSHVYQQSSKISNKKVDLNHFDGPVYYSERYQPKKQNPQQIKQINCQEQMYKFDKNPKLLKFKLSLKRQSLNLTEKSKQTEKLLPQKKSLSRILITQGKTQQSNISGIDSPSKRYESIGTTKRLDSINSLSTQNGYNSRQLRPKSLKIPKLPQNSHLNKAIKLFQRKQTLLGQIQSNKGLQHIYGNRMFQYLLRNRYHQHQRKNDFTINIHHKKSNKLTQNNIKSKFIKDIEQGKYDTNFKYKQRQMNLKLKGRNQSIKRHILTDQAGQQY